MYILEMYFLSMVSAFQRNNWEQRNQVSKLSRNFTTHYNNPLSGNLYLQRKDEIYISSISAVSRWK